LALLFTTAAARKWWLICGANEGGFSIFRNYPFYKGRSPYVSFSGKGGA